MNITALNLSVKNKLYVGFAAVALLALLTGGIGYVQIQSIHSDLEFITERMFVVQDLSLEMTINSLESAEIVTEYVSYAQGDSAVRSEWNAMKEAMDEFEQELSALVTLVDDEELTSASAEVDHQHELFIDAGETMMEAYDTANEERPGDWTYVFAQVTPYMEAFDVELITFHGQLIDLEHRSHNLLLAAQDKAEATVATSTTIILATSGIALVSAVVLGVLISRGITNPLMTLVSDAGIVAKGNLGHEFEVQDRHDEIGEVISAIKDMVRNTANLVGSVQNAADTVVSMSQELSSTAQQANASMQQVSSATQQIAQGAAQLSTLSQESSSNANRLSAVLQQTGANSEKAGESIQQIMNAMESTTTTVESMDTSLEEIGNLANLVTDVANQTQLLALNAAIEAARAGEAGRGFAVVADAVRELSEQTNQAAADTLKSVSDVQKNGKNALEVARSSTTDASEGVDVVNETIAGVNQGVGAVEAVVKAIDEMASIAEEAASSAEENTAAAEEQTAAMGQLANNAANLEEIASQLQAEMTKFQL